MNEEKIELEELKRIELNVLNEIHAICAGEGLRYSLCGGTLLGAVRHGGFIPWDDDIDIFMPRPDYNKFLEICKTRETPFKVISSETNPKYGYLFAKAYDPRTIIREENGNRNDAELGVYVDIFPIDGLGDTYDEAKSNFQKTRFDRELLVAYNWRRFFKSITHSFFYEPVRLAFFILSRFVKSEKLIKRIQSKYPSESFDASKYAGVICGSYRLKEILPSDVYSQFELIKFEEREYMAIKGKEKYLESIYGDYMRLPPEEKRVSNHSFEARYK